MRKCCQGLPICLHIHNLQGIHRITSYNVCYTKLLRHYKAVDIEYDDTHLFSVLQDEIKQKVSGVVYACGFHMCNNHDLKIGDHYENYDIGFAGADFFKMFTYPLITSLPEALFTSPYEAVITSYSIHYTKLYDPT